MEHEQPTTPLKAIRANCLDCNGNAAEVKLCPCTSCPMYPFRFGKNPYLKRTLTPEQLSTSRGNLVKARATKNGTLDTY